MSRRADRCTPEFREALGARVRALRHKRYFTLRELADRMRMSFVALQQIEVGHSEPTATTLLLLSRELGCTTDYLVKGEHDADVPQAVQAR